MWRSTGATQSRKANSGYDIFTAGDGYVRTKRSMARYTWMENWKNKTLKWLQTYFKCLLNDELIEWRVDCTETNVNSKKNDFKLETVRFWCLKNCKFFWRETSMSKYEKSLLTFPAKHSNRSTYIVKTRFQTCFANKIDKSWTPVKRNS